MALIQCHFFSEVLGLNTSMTVILPQNTYAQIGMQNVSREGKHPTLYLLHGRSDDDTTWVRRTSIERYVAPLGLAVVMPQVHLSYYTDMAYGNRYFTFVSEELPIIARSFFHLSEAREDNFVAGLSMGGYGAMKIALTYPERFAAAASLSGALDVCNTKWVSSIKNYQQIFGDEPVKGSDNDLLWLLDKCDKIEGTTPKLFQCCGTEDFLYEQNAVFRQKCEKSSFDYTYDEGPGIHDWTYWDEKIQDVLAWLPLRQS